MNAMNQGGSVSNIFQSTTTIDQDSREFKIKNEKMSVAFNSHGLLKAITDPTAGHTSPIHLDFAK